MLVGITGGSGVIYGVRLLEALKELKIETHLVMTNAAKKTLALETTRKVSEVESLVSASYRINDIAAPPASGSFRSRGMVVVPCSTKTLAGIANGYLADLLLRAAEATLKERRPLIVVPRETPLTRIHLENMMRAADAGAVILPAMPAFYTRPKTMENLVDFLVGKILDVFEIEHTLYGRWGGPMSARAMRVARGGFERTAEVPPQSPLCGSLAEFPL